MPRPDRIAPDLSGYPDMVVVYLGLRARSFRGLLTAFGLGPQIRKSWTAEPDGLLLHEDLAWSVIPLHLGMRQYWRDQESLERWTRSNEHAEWWRKFVKDMRGVGFWHEAYHVRGGFDAIYIDMAKPTGIGRFAPMRQARGTMYSARRRAAADGEPQEPVVSEGELYAS
jgi:hypothetical protein